ncbi:radical SAM protein [Actinoallomurus sp. CA-150999]|uniref:radical SAM protein n=1 Tax=Actinoallomurus sp. CA-150999 TaxID=3239887 RepID=UPI003D8A2CFC
MHRNQTRFVWLEITGKCQLQCTHCYNESGPTGTHGMMTVPDWRRVIDEAAELGVELIQFIGGEPTLHPALPELVDHGLERGMEVEVFSNLVHVRADLWDTFTRPGVRLATSWYSDDPIEHAAITRRPGHLRTRANIAEAVRRSIPLRVGIIGVLDGQRTRQAEAMLADLGVTDIGYDDLRQIGRGVRDRPQGVDQLCGACTSGNVAVGPDGTVWPCVMARWLPIGNVNDSTLSDIVVGPQTASVTEYLNAHFEPIEAPCTPKMCNPQCGPSCSPACNPQNNCRPKGNCAPSYSCGPCSPKDRTCSPDMSCRPNNCRPTR